MKYSNIQVLWLPLVLSFLILWICYPGFMSYDSIRMLEEARSSVRGGIYPAAPVYILRFFDMFGHGPTIMLQVQNIALLFTIAFIIKMLGASSVKAFLVLMTDVISPTVIGCMLVLWKDVTLTAFLMAAVVLIYSVSCKNKPDATYQSAKWFSMIFLIIATLVRFNSISATVFVFLYWLLVFFKNHTLAQKAGLFVAIVISLLASNKLINGYSFPDLKRLEANPIVYAIMINDIIGISGWSRDSLLPINASGIPSSPKISISDIDKIYSSLGAVVMGEKNASLGNIVRVFPGNYSNDDEVAAWLSAIYKHPVAYLRYRWDLFSEIIGAKSHATFEPTHFGRIDENIFDIKFKDRSITTFALEYIRASSSIFLGKPWFIFLMSSIAAVLVGRSNLVKHEDRVLSFFSFAIAFFYITPFFVISGTGEVRYCFPAIVFAAIPIFVFLFSRHHPQSVSVHIGGK